jgi:DNA-binding MarR family transcriptional regulator
MSKKTAANGSVGPMRRSTCISQAIQLKVTGVDSYRGPYCEQAADTISCHGIIPLYEQGNLLELFVQGCLESMGVSLLMDWDILIFLYHHGVILSSANQIARLLGCESTRIGNALDSLESRRLIESSRPSGGVRFYKVVVSSDGSRQSCFQQLLSLTGNRAGRLMLAKILKPDTPEVVPGVRSVHLS